MITLYDNQSSGNGYKARLILELTGTPYDHRETPFNEEGTRGDAFRAINPWGKIPCVVFDDGKVLTESNAILICFAEGTDYLPGDKFERAQVYEWLFFEQYYHEPCIAVVRHWLHDGNLDDLQKAQLLGKIEGGYRALDRMENALKQADWLVGSSPSIADLALYAYTHVAEEGDFDLSPYAGIQRWIARVETLQGWVPLVPRGEVE